MTDPWSTSLDLPLAAEASRDSRARLQHPPALKSRSFAGVVFWEQTASLPGQGNNPVFLLLGKLRGDRVAPEMHLKAHQCLQACPVPGSPLLLFPASPLPAALHSLHEDRSKAARAPSFALGPRQQMSSHNQHAAPPPSSLLLLPPLLLLRMTATFCSSQARHSRVPFQRKPPKPTPDSGAIPLPGGHSACSPGSVQKRPALLGIVCAAEPAALGRSLSGAQGSHTCRSQCSGMSPPAPCLSPSSHTCPSRCCSTELF